MSLSFFIFSCRTGNLPQGTQTLQVLMDQQPLTLNPRMALDAMSQRIGVLIYRSLTRLDNDLEPQPDLSEKWTTSKDGKRWTFTIRPSLHDHAGLPITPNDIALCLENYRAGTPASNLQNAFPNWTRTLVTKTDVVLDLKAPDPYFPRNLSALRFFRVKGQARPCMEPTAKSEVITSGPYRLDHWELSPQDSLLLIPVTDIGAPRLNFSFITDDNTKLLKLIHGDFDVTQNTLSTAKTKWLREHHSQDFNFLERPGVGMGYLSFNLRDPLLKDVRIRQAIAHALDRPTIIRDKHGNLASEAGSFLSPLLPENFQTSIPFDPSLSEQLLEQAGLKKNAQGHRLTLKYKTTTNREGMETALIFQSMLARVGIRLEIEVVEPAVFFASIRKGNFQLYSSRWLGIADGSILYRTLHSQQPNNRAGYKNPVMDGLLEHAITELDFRRRKDLLKKVQQLMAKDLPYLPLWYWNNSLIMRKNSVGLKPQDLSLSGGLEPLTRLRTKL